MSIYEASITNPKKQLEFYKDLSDQLQKENKNLKKLIINIMEDHHITKIIVDKYFFLKSTDKVLLSTRTLDHKTIIKISEPKEVIK